MRAAPAVSCAKLCEETHTSIQVQRRHSGIPCAMVLRLMASSPATNSFCHRHRRIGGFVEPGWADKTSADLTPATGARTTRFCRTQPPVFAKRLRRALAPSSCVKDIAHGITRPATPLRAQRCRVHRIPSPTFVTIMIRPSGGPGWGKLVALICPTGPAKYFFRQVWTGQITLKLQRKIGSARTAFWAGSSRVYGALSRNGLAMVSPPMLRPCCMSSL
jgi:hypothetical protein